MQRKSLIGPFLILYCRHRCLTHLLRYPYIYLYKLGQNTFSWYFTRILKLNLQYARWHLALVLLGTVGWANCTFGQPSVRIVKRQTKIWFCLKIWSIKKRWHRFFVFIAKCSKLKEAINTKYMSFNNNSIAYVCMFIFALFWWVLIFWSVYMYFIPKAKTLFLSSLLFRSPPVTTLCKMLQNSPTACQCVCLFSLVRNWKICTHLAREEAFVDGHCHQKRLPSKLKRKEIRAPKYYL